MDAETLRKLEALPYTGIGSKRRVFTEEEDGALLRFWMSKPKSAVARTLGISVGTCRSRYLELTQGGTT